MGFWDKALGVGAVPAPNPAAPSPAPAASQPWFQQTAYTPPPTPFTPVVPDPSPQPQQVPTKAKSARSTATCPDCGSGNYLVHEHGNSMSQCYDCGHNPRFAHSTAGAGMPSPAGGGTIPTQPAKQVSTANNFNPQMVVDRVPH